MARAKTKRKSALHDLTRQHIRDAVVRVITEVGVHGLTMARVADEAGIAKGTLYRYFTTKSDLIRDTIDDCLAPMRSELVALAKESLPPEERLRRMTLRHLSFFEEHRDFFRVLLHERSRAQARVGRSRSGVYQALVEATAGVLREGIDSGDFRPLDPGKLGAMIIDANIAVIGHRLLADRAGSVEDDAMFLSSVLMNGIGMKQRVTGGRK